MANNLQLLHPLMYMYHDRTHPYLKIYFACQAHAAHYMIGQSWLKQHVCQPEYIHSQDTHFYE